MRAHGATTASSPQLADELADGRPAKRRGSLASTLDPQLQPRRHAIPIGRPPGARNFEWTPEIDRLLTEAWANRPSVAKRIVARAIQQSRPTITSSEDSLRKAVERRMAKLGIANVGRRQKTARISKRWTKSQTAALLGALGADASIESIALRTGHSVKAVRAKIARLGYKVQEIHGFLIFTVAELADLLQVTPRQIRRWKERGWLDADGRRVTEKDLGQFLRDHPELVPFDKLPREQQVFLADLGFPSRRSGEFKKNVREILDGIGRQRKPRRPIRTPENASIDSREEKVRRGAFSEPLAGNQ